MAGPVALGWTAPDELVRGVDTPVSVTLTQDGAALTITSATVTVYRPDGSVLVTASPTPSANTASYTVDADLYADDDPGEGWRVAWSVTTAQGTLKHQNSAALVLYQVALVATTADMLELQDQLRNLRTDTALTTLLSAALRQAWITIRARLRQKGRRPYLVLSSDDLRESTLLLALSNAFRRCATGGEGTWEWAQAADYEAKFEACWERLTFLEADPATWKSTGRRRSVQGSFWLGSGAGRSTLRQLPSRIG